MSDDLKKVSLFEELRNLCQGLEDALSDATLIINRQEDRIEELEAKLEKAIEALDEAIYLLAPDEEDIAKKTGLYRIVKAFKELKGDQP